DHHQHPPRELGAGRGDGRAVGLRAARGRRRPAQPLALERGARHEDRAVDHHDRARGRLPEDHPRARAQRSGRAGRGRQSLPAWPGRGVVRAPDAVPGGPRRARAAHRRTRGAGLLRANRTRSVPHHDRAADRPRSVPDHGRVAPGDRHGGRAPHPHPPRPVVHLPLAVASARGGCTARRHDGGRADRPDRGPQDGRVRIGIVSQSYYPRYGGVTEHVHALAHELRRRGHDVTIITSFFRRGEKGFRDGVLRIGWNILVPFNRAFVDFAIGISLKGRLKRAIRELDLDIVHVHNPGAPTLPIFAVQVSDRPTVGTFHSTGGRTAIQDLFRPMIMRTLSRLDGRIAVSSTAKTAAELYHPGPYHVIPNGVDVERFHPLIKPFEQWRDPAHTNILFVGRLDPRKGVQDLIAAMPEVVERTDGRARLLV